MNLAARQRLNIILAAALIALGGLVAYLALNRDEAGTGERLTPLTNQAVNHILIERGDKPTVELALENGEWWLLQPFRIAASRYRAESLAALATEESVARYPVEGLDLARYGLDPGLAQIRLNDTEIVFGTLNPLNKTRYVRVGDTVHLIADGAFGILNAEVPSFVGPRLLPAGTDLEALHMPGVGIERAGEAWRLDPERPDIGADDIRRLLEVWQQAQALWAKPYSGREPQGVVELRLANGEVLRFEVMETDPDLVLARPDLELEYTLPAERMHDLLELTPAPAPEDAVKKSAVE